jgi:Flavodoxins
MIAIFYYSNSGNTKALVEESIKDFDDIDVFNLKEVNDFSVIDKYNIILIGTPTLGNGVPPKYFAKHQLELKKYLTNKKIGLFGSGNTIYPYFCGALDLLWDWLKNDNEMLFKFKFESYPTQKTINDFKELLNSVKG